MISHPGLYSPTHSIAQKGVCKFQGLYPLLQKQNSFLFQSYIDIAHLKLLIIDLQHAPNKKLNGLKNLAKYVDSGGGIQFLLLICNP